MLFDKLNLSIAEAVKEIQKKDETKEGNAFSKALMAAKEKGEKTFTLAGKCYDVKTEQEIDAADKKDVKKVEEKTDPVDPKAAAKDFKDRKDKDIDNDGDVDDSDEYLHKRRKAGTKDVEEGMSDKKAVAAIKAMLDGMSKDDAIKKFGVSPKKLDQVRKNLFKEDLDENVELDEASAWSKAAKELNDYARKNGGIDKKDMMQISDMLHAIGKANIMKKATKLANMSATMQKLDTDVREKIASILKKNGLMEELEEARKYKAPTQAEIDADKKKDKKGGSSRAHTGSKQYKNMMGGLKEEEVEEATQKAKEGPDASEQEKLEPRAKGEKEFADKHDVETKDGEKDEADSMKKIEKDVKKAAENKAKSMREAIIDIWNNK